MCVGIIKCFPFTPTHTHTHAQAHKHTHAYTASMSGSVCVCRGVWVDGLHIDWFHHKEEGNTNLLCRILKVQQGLRGALEEESQLVLLGGCLPLALRRWCSVKHFGKHSGTRRQHSLQWREKESDCRSRMMMLRRLRSDLIPAHAHAHTERHTRTRTLAHWHLP